VIFLFFTFEIAIRQLKIPVFLVLETFMPGSADQIKFENLSKFTFFDKTF